MNSIITHQQTAEKNLRSRYWLVNLISIAFAFLMFSVPWEWLRGGILFEDKGVYLERFIYLQSIIEEQNISTVWSFFINEALWDYLVRTTSVFFNLPVVTVLGCVTVLCLFMFAKFLITRHSLFSLILLVNPIMIDLAFDQLRIALAVSLLAMVLLSQRKIVKWVLIVLASFIHTASILFVLMYFAAIKINQWRKKIHLSAAFLTMALIGLGIVVALIVGPFREGLLTYLGDRRAVYGLGGSTFLYVSFWSMLLFLFFFQKEKFYTLDSNLFAVVCISTFVSTTLLGVFGARFIAASFPLILSSILSLDKTYRFLMIPAYLIFTIVQWLYWLQF